MTTYVKTQQEILAEAQPHADRYRELVRRSDDLLERLESLNLGHFGAVRNWTGFDAVRLTTTLARAINELLIEVDLDPRRLTTTRAALDAVYDAQDVLFRQRRRQFLGDPDDDDEETEA